MRTIISFVLVMALFSACQNTRKKKSDGGKETSSVALTAAGATFPMPYYNMVFKNYTNETGVLLTYGGIGSGGGIRSLTDKVVDFGATDAYLDDDKLAGMPGEVLHIPTCLGAVVIAYNLSGIDDLKLSDNLLEKIFMGEITRWNDAAIQANNPGVKFLIWKLPLFTVLTVVELLIFSVII